MQQFTSGGNKLYINLTTCNNNLQSLYTGTDYQ